MNVLRKLEKRKDSPIKGPQAQEAFYIKTYDLYVKSCYRRK